jgi:hypothetical protein
MVIIIIIITTLGSSLTSWWLSSTINLKTILEEEEAAMRRLTTSINYAVEAFSRGLGAVRTINSTVTLGRTASNISVQWVWGDSISCASRSRDRCGYDPVDLSTIPLFMCGRIIL